MASNTPTPYTPSVNSAPSMTLPGHVDGFIDLTTLADINRYLNQSALEEDQALATWVKQNYLYEPIDSPGREIRTTEGFSKLDRAYRRVRSLTNKAQDKWPFFDRKWKSMSSTTVRNNARGEAAPGVSLPGMNGVARDSPMTNGHDSHKDEPASVKSSFVSFGPNKPRLLSQRSHLRPQEFSKPIPNTPVPIPGSKQAHPESLSSSEKLADITELPQPLDQLQTNSTASQGLPEHTDSLSRSSYQTTAQSDLAQDFHSNGVQVPSDEPAETTMSVPGQLQPSEGSAVLHSATEEEIAREAGGGKVRGPNGRYLPKNTTSPKPTKSRRSTGGPKAKSLRKSTAIKETTLSLQEVAPSSPAHVGSDDTTLVDADSIPASVHGHEPGKQNGPDNEIASATEPARSALIADDDLGEAPDRSFSEPTSNHLLHDMASNGFTITYTLAAEADPVSSNLDRLPPSSLRRHKRKSEPAPTSNLPPRKRGRPRKDQTQKPSDQPTEKEAVNETPALQEEKVVEEEVPRMTTRRTTRRSTVANTDTAAPVKDSTEMLPDEQLKVTEDEEQTMVDVDDVDNTAGRKASLPEPVVGKPSKRTPAKRQDTYIGPSQPTAFVSTDLPHEPDVDLLELGLRKTGPPSKRSEPRKPAISQLEINKPASAPVSAPQLTNGTTNGVVTNPSPSTSGSVRVEYFARVHTSMGVMEAGIESDKIDEEMNLVRDWADLMETEGAQLPFKLYKSIYAKANKTKA